MKATRSCLILIPTCLLACVLNGQSLSVIYNFQCSPDVSDPNGLIVGPSGVLYGTSYAGGAANLGAAFELIPPGSGGAWTEQVIHSFGIGSDGSHPGSNLVLGSNGVLYGTTPAGGSADDGVVFELTPPKVRGGSWEETIIHTFLGGTDGNAPFAPLLPGKNGEFYGVTAYGGVSGADGYGTLFKLTPPRSLSGLWTEEVLYAFQPTDVGQNPEAGIVFGPGGSIFGTTPIVFGEKGPVTYGTVYQLSPPASPGAGWTITSLYKFPGGSAGGAPEGTLTVTARGEIVGTGAVGGEYNQGVAYTLSPPATGETVWTYNKIYDFSESDAGPSGSLIPDASGALIGASVFGGPQGLGSIFALFPPSRLGGKWSLYDVIDSTGAAGGPLGPPLTRATANSVYGEGSEGGPHGCGSVFVDSYVLP